MQQAASPVVQLCFIPSVRGETLEESLEGMGQLMIRSSARWGDGYNGPRQNGPGQAETAALLFFAVSQKFKLYSQKSCRLLCL